MRKKSLILYVSIFARFVHSPRVGATAQSVNCQWGMRMRTVFPHVNNLHVSENKWLSF